LHKLVVMPVSSSQGQSSRSGLQQVVRRHLETAIRQQQQQQQMDT
jgi:hypothetical protein